MREYDEFYDKLDYFKKKGGVEMRESMMNSIENKLRNYGIIVIY